MVAVFEIMGLWNWPCQQYIKQRTHYVGGQFVMGKTHTHRHLYSYLCEEHPFISMSMTLIQAMATLTPIQP